MKTAGDIVHTDVIGQLVVRRIAQSNAVDVDITAPVIIGLRPGEGIGLVVGTGVVTYFVVGGAIKMYTAFSTIHTNVILENIFVGRGA